MNTEDKIVIPAEHISDQYDLREYAAIHLRIPDSGTEWLDKMIAKAERRDIAAKAMQSLCDDYQTEKAYKIADAMIQERDKGE